jgi:hypothetical protein
MNPKKDLLSDLDIARLFESRGEAAEKQKEAAGRLIDAEASHLAFCLVGGCVLMAAAVSLGEVFPDDEPASIFLRSACIVLGLAMWLAAFFPSITAHRLQDEATATSKQLKAIDDKIAFCHLVLDEAKRVKVRKYAEAWVEKELS